MEYRKTCFEVAMLLTCKRCPNVFEASRSYQKFCSAKCRQNDENERYRPARAKRSREYSQKKFGWKPKPTEPISCTVPECKNIFVPSTSWQRTCCKKCRTRLHYIEHTEYHLEKSKRIRLKTHAAWKARGRMTWAEMKAQRGTLSRFAKARQPWTTIFTGVRHRALAKNIPFDLTREWCIARWTGRCELTGIEFALNTKKRDSFAPSIDKIDPDKGYVQSNCRFILWAVNAFKFTGTDETMYSIARTLITNRIAATK
jgi:hypothetical protein